MGRKLTGAVAGLASLAMLGLVGVTGVPAEVARRLTTPSGAAAAGPVDKAAVAAAYGNLPLRFEANVGQADPEASFIARSQGGTLFLTDHEAVLSVAKARQGGSTDPGVVGPMTPATSEADRSAVVRLRPLNANPGAKPVGAEQLPGVTNYLIGNDPAKWNRDVASFGAVRYPEVYPGIDQVFHGKQDALEYDFVVAPGVDPSVIALGVDGTTGMTVEPSGDLVMHTAAGDVRQNRPVLYQEIDGARRPVHGSFLLNGTNEIRFHVGAYDRSLPLVIDPVIAYSDLIGGTGDDDPSGIAVDATGAAYLSGTTSSADYPTRDPLQATKGSSGPNPQDFFVSKLTPDGSALVYSTYLGGSNGDQNPSIAVDAAGAAHVAGQTNSGDFPMAGSSFDPACGDEGTCRAHATFTDGATTAGSPTFTSASAKFDTGLDVGRTITGPNLPAGTTITAVVDPTTVTLSANATETGTGLTFTILSRGFPINDVVMAKLTPDGSALAYATFLGGSDNDTPSGFGGGITVNSRGNVFITGKTVSTNFPTTDGTVSGTRAGYDRFCGTATDFATGQPDGSCNRNARFTDGSSTAGSPTYTTAATPFDNRDVGRGITGTNIPDGTTITAIVRAPGVPSYESSTTITLSNAATGTGTGLTFIIAGRDSQNPKSDAFVARINPTATTGPASLAYSTYLGGSGHEDGNGVASEPPGQYSSSGGVYVVGRTDGLGFPTTPGTLQPGCSGLSDPAAACIFGSDAFVVKLLTDVNGDGSLTGGDAFATYLGSRGGDYATAVAADSSGAYVTGYAGGPGFPTRNAFQHEAGDPSGNDAFVSKLTPDGTALVYSTFLGGSSGEGGQGIAVDTDRQAHVTGGTNSADFPTKDSILGYTQGFLTKLAASGTALEYSTFLSVRGDVATNPAGDGAAYVAGSSSSSTFPAVSGSLRAGPGGGTDAAVVKLVAGSTPVVNRLNPRGGPTSGGTPVLISGERFTGVTNVSFGGVPATSFTVSSDFSITAVSPPHAEGSIAELTTFVTVTGPQATSLSVGAARYVYGEGVFNATGSCVGDRCPTGGQAVTMANGKVLYTSGTGTRYINDTLPALAQVYDPLTGTWAATAACTDCGNGTLFHRPSVVALPAGPLGACGANCGKVLVAGGLLSSSGEPTAAAFLYDPAAGTWAPTGSMTTPRADQSTTLLADGKVLVAGGCPLYHCLYGNNASTLATAELYDPATGAWTRTAGDMTMARSGHTATLLDTSVGACGPSCGKVLVSFGSGTGDEGPGLAEAELFDPTTGTFTATGASLGTGRTFHSAVQLADGGVMAVGGNSAAGAEYREAGLDSSEIYDPVAGTWRLTGILNFPRPGKSGPAIRLPNGKVLVTGGPATDIAEIWSPSDGRWRSATSSAFTPRSHLATALLPSGPASVCGTNCGKVLVAGGTDPTRSDLPMAGAELYTPKPDLTALAPVTGNVGSSVTITGTGLAAVTSASFGSVATTAVTHDPANPDGVLTVVVPAGASGAVDVTVSSPGGVSAVVAAGRFTVTPPPPPTLTSISPSSAAVGATVTITGTGLGPVTSVSFGSVSTTAITHDAANPDGVLTVVVPAGASGTVNVTVTSPSGVSAVVPAGSFTVTPVGFSTFVAVSPARILDTRSGNGAPAARIGAGQSVDVQVTGRGGVPGSGVTAVALNVTAVQPSAGSFVTVWPTGETRPLASNVNLDGGTIVPNLTVVKVGAGGRVSLYNDNGNADLVADVAGYYLEPGAAVPGSTFAPLSPARILDTRIGNGAPAAPVGAGRAIDVQITGQGGVPASGVTAVAVNVTAVTPSAESFVTAWPTGESRPTASNLNQAAGVTRPNMVIVKLGAGGKVSLYNDNGNVDLLADVAGYYLDPAAAPASTFTAVSPARILDTRTGAGAPAARVGAGQAIDVQVTGQGGVPATGVTSVVMNVTAVNPTSPSFVTAWPAGEAKPLASNLNLNPGVTVANLVILKVGAGGKVTLYNSSGTTDLIADVAGYNAT